MRYEIYRFPFTSRPRRTDRWLVCLMYRVRRILFLEMYEVRVVDTKTGRHWVY